MRENTRLKNEVRMFREELGLKAVPDPVSNESEMGEDLGPPLSMRSAKNSSRPESSKGVRLGHNRSIASAKNLTGTP